MECVVVKHGGISQGTTTVTVDRNGMTLVRNNAGFCRRIMALGKTSTIPGP